MDASKSVIPRMKVLCSFVKLLLLFSLALELASEAQLREAGGPFINDQLPWGYRFGGGPQIVGPRFAGVRQVRGGGRNNILHALTSGTSVFDNGSIFAATSFDSGLGGLFRLNPRLQGTRGNTVTNGQGLKVGLGPLAFYDFEGGVGAFYTEYDNQANIRDDSGWSTALTLSGTALVNLPYLSLGGQISGYYLPSSDEWGFGLPGALVNLGNLGVIDPGVSFGVASKGNLAGWDFVIYDTFTAEAVAADLSEYVFDEPTRSLGSGSLSLPSATASDRVGRYTFGGRFLDREAGVDDRFKTRFANRGGGFLNQDRMFSTNSVGIMAGKLLSPTVRNLYWLRRDDFWATNEFNRLGNFTSGGAYFDSYGSVYVRPYAGYQFGTFNDFESINHVIKVGSWGSLSPDITYLVNLGWLWTSGLEKDQNTGIYDFMVAQSLGNRFQHYIGGGRAISDPTFGESYLRDYGTYGISYLIDSETVIQAVMGISKNDGSLSGTRDAKQYYGGVRLRRSFGKSFMSLSAINERFEFNSTGQVIDQWVYKALYSLPLSARTTAYTGYQYIDSQSNRGVSAFKEHLLLFYMTHRF